MPPIHQPFVITLTTDFELTDHYAGTLKGVIYSVCPEARIVDITHNVTPFNVLEGAFLIEQAWRFFPAGTVHVIVVDPGVGSARRPILLEADGHYFVAPDNGVLSMVISGAQRTAVHWLQSEQYFLPKVSQVFHGRDIFAPVSAHLANGVAPEEFGPAIDNHLRLTIERPVRTARRGWTGAVAHIDRFGNVVTNFRSLDFPQVSGEHFELSIGMRLVDTYATAYAESESGDLFVIGGSSGYLEVACNQASAAGKLGVGIGAPVELRLLGPKRFGTEEAE